MSFFDIKTIGSYEDGIFNLHYFYYVKKAVYIDEPLYHYRKYETNNAISITSGYNPQLSEQWEKLYLIMKQYIEEKNLSSVYNTALKNRIAMGLLGQGLNILAAPYVPLKKIKMLREIINSKNYSIACKQLNFRYLPLHWKIFYGCAKYKITIGVYVLLLCIRKAIGK